MEFVMRMFTNTSGVPLNTTKPMLDGSIVGGTTKTIISYPTRYGHCVAVQFGDNSEVRLSERKETAFVFNNKILVVRIY
jgi:hypothetical protein